MGRIRTRLVKRAGAKLYTQNPERFQKTTFDDNKKAVTEMAVIQSKKLRNLIAGYITKLAKEKQ
ncbi:MAG: 30S ribosomal protein S17e [Nanoarchaeota archaeon]